MPDRGTLGQILLELGKITEADVDRALEYQSRHGGYFGEALQALGIVSAEELEWGLASQFDLPYIFPDPEAIDPDAANMVSPEWALTHQSIPIMRSGDTLTVVVDSPLRTEIVAELRERTGLEVELALASPVQIRELIRRVYARATTRDEGEAPLPCSMEEAMSRAAAARASRFGISVRGRRAWFWYDDAGTLRRRPLDVRWAGALDAMSTPAVLDWLGAHPGGPLEVELSRESGVTAAEVRHLQDGGDEEILFLVQDEEEEGEHPFTPPGEGILTEVALLARTGSARFLVSSEPPELVNEVLHHLPGVFFEPSWRSVHIHASGDGPEDAFSVRLPDDADAWDEALEDLRAFHFDVLTADLGGDGQGWTARLLDVASVAFIRRDDGSDTSPAVDAGVRWKLHAIRTEGGHLDWTLEALDT